ncbi:unconventional myosin-XIX [Fopius arisanus]|uniref:MYO19_1 protein n=2 Tax=Fopius arisanus TaxID=64838 RepID=A0A0C9RYI5_9HYME|nr:PREDICTED: unconventional myosin-XIX-like [Fopius arisanus]
MAKTPISPFGWEYINDLSAISEDIDSIEYLLHRLERGQIYTWVGPLLLAVNPGIEILSDLYDESHHNQYSKDMGMVLLNAPPHLYAIANRARYRLVQGLGNKSQVIVISGESGTGKTFSSRKILDFLAGIDRNTGKLKFSDGVENIAHEIGNVCPLVSAFSTGSTKRNPSSSRHGQLVQLQYNGGAITGACIHSFLLERTRVTQGYDNFEIFYQMMVGLSLEELSPLGLSQGDNYEILGESHPSRFLTYQNAFVATAQAMQTLGFTDTYKSEIFQVLALLLHMGNIKFHETSPENWNMDTTDEKSLAAVTNACRLSSLQEHELAELLTTTLICPKSTRRRHTMYRRGLRTSEACRHRLFSIIRWIYDRLFHSLVDRINDTISDKGDNHWLGILDIFGFECFESNGIEQLCINYTTERLQLYFMEDYLENGQRALAEEGLSVLPPPPTLTIYRNRLSIIEQSLFSTMNDACQTPRPPSPSIVSQQLFMRQSNARIFLKGHAHSFVISHYSCPVEYDIHDLLEKNTDKVPMELSTSFYQTSNSLLKVVTNVPDDTLNDHGRIASKKSTTLSKLKSSMDSLMVELNKCDAHYIRCVKPRRAEDCVKEDLREQLISSGIIDALPLAKCKFPIRLTYEEFSRRYYLPIHSIDFKMQFEAALRKIVGSENIAVLMHLGSKRIFMTESLFFELERYRKEHRAACARKIEDFWLTHREKMRNKLQGSEEILLKPAIIVTRPSLNPFEDISCEEKPGDEQSMEIIDPEINNNMGKTGFIPQIAVNDHIVDLVSPMATRVLKDASGSEAQDDATNLPLRRMQPESVKNQVNVEATGWRTKDRYVAEWLGNVSPPADSVFEEDDDDDRGQEDQSQVERTNFRKSGRLARFGRSEAAPVFNCLSKAEWSNEGTTVVCLDGHIRFFYKDRVLSKRRLAEVPLRFHFKKTGLINSCCLPRSEIPRGLQDCL